MNQILMTQPAKNKKTKPVKDTWNNNAGKKDIKSIVKFFAIAIIVFGLAISGSGAYALVENIQQKKSSSVPAVITERTGNSIKLTVKNDVGIKSVKYAWNDSTAKVVEGKNQKEVSVIVSIIAGNNKLNITVLDSNNNTTQYVKNYVQNETDTTEPVITVSNEDPKIKITVTDDTALDHVVYKYGDNAEVTVQASTEDPTKLEIYIDNVEEAKKTLTIEAIDKAQNHSTKTQDVKGATKPKIEVAPDPTDASYLIIKATDNDGIRMISYYINGQEYQTDPNTSLDTKTFEYKQKVEKGQTNITVHAYNLSEQVTEFIGVYTY